MHCYNQWISHSLSRIAVLVFFSEYRKVVSYISAFVFSPHWSGLYSWLFGCVWAERLEWSPTVCHPFHAQSGTLNRNFWGYCTHLKARDCNYWKVFWWENWTRTILWHVWPSSGESQFFLGDLEMCYNVFLRSWCLSGCRHTWSTPAV